MNRTTPTQERSLAALLAATSRGDRAAFRKIYEATAPKLFGIVLRIIGNRAVAEEVLQETYIKIWQNADRYIPEAGQPIGWLAAIARNRAIDRLRSEKIDRSTASDGEAILARLAAPADGDPVARESLARCLRQLESEARDCVILAYCSGFSREELAERYGRPVGTIKTLLHRSVRQLRACLETE